MDHSFFLIRVVGVIGVALEVYGFVSTNPRTLRVTNVFSGLIWTVQSLLLGAFVNAIAHGINTFRKLFSIFTLNSTPITKWSFAAVFSVLGLVLYSQSNFSLSDTTAVYCVIAGSVAYFALSNSNSRLMLMTCSVSWVISGVIVGAYELALLQLFVFPSLLIGYLRVKREESLLLSGVAQ